MATAKTLEIAILWTLAFVLQGQSIPLAETTPDQRFQLGYSRREEATNSFNQDYAIAGRNNQNSTSNHQLGFVNVGKNEDGLLFNEGKFEVGVYKHTNANSNSSIKALSMGVETGTGAMARLPLVEAERNMGKVGISAGVTFDTGVIARKGEFEVKVLGIGTRLGKNGIQVCIWICFGIKY